MGDFVLVKLSGPTVDIICSANPNNHDFVGKECRKQVLYLCLVKVLYGCVHLALLWYNLLSTTLKDMGFTLNPYDTCITNKIVDGTQCTICWYVDDTKISHMLDPQVVTNVIREMEMHFGDMAVTRGRQNTFLGMDLCFQEDATVKIDKGAHVQDAISTSPDNASKQAVTPAKKDLFAINKKSLILTMDMSDLFHCIIAKLLYISKRG